MKRTSQRYKEPKDRSIIAILGEFSEEDHFTIAKESTIIVAFLIPSFSRSIYWFSKYVGLAETIIGVLSTAHFLRIILSSRTGLYLVGNIDEATAKAKES